MASLYPTQLDNFSTNRTNATPNDPAQRDDHNDHADAINKIESELGIAPSGSYATVRAKLDALMLNPPSQSGLASVWDATLGRMIFKKITDAEIDSAASMAVTKLTPGSVGQVLVTNAGPTVGWGSIVAIPTGVIMPFGGYVDQVPAGFLICQGQEISRVTYATLFGVIGGWYGVGNGSTTFNLPDLRGRFPAGLGQNGEVDTLGKNEGAGVPNRKPGHYHTWGGSGTTGFDTPDHAHIPPSPNEGFIYNQNTGAGWGGLASGSYLNSTGATSGATSRHTHAFSLSGNTSGPGGHQDRAAFLVVNFIIKT